MLANIVQQPWFSRITKPSRYLGGEINSIKKDPADIQVFFALTFPDVYEIGMSHIGLKVLYHILNSHDWIAAERVFSPWMDLESELKARKIPLSSLESGKPLYEFDIIGFSLQHELCYTNILTILDLAQIPFLAKQRSVKYPFIIAGGPACFNPEPVAEIFDLFVVGDGEELAPEICRILREWKRGSRPSKPDLLKELSGIKGVYVPSFFAAHYNEKGLFHLIEPLTEGYNEVEKRLVSDINRYPFPCSQIIPLAEPVHDRFTIEISRGCDRGCRFCQAGMIYRPVRERNPGEILRTAKEGLRATGFEDLSLLSLSAGDYTCIAPLLKNLTETLSGMHVAMNLSSLRVDGDFSLLMEEIKKARKTSFTIAPEAGTDRLRNIINKGFSEGQILNTSREIYQGGWRLIKLYFMIGLPWETYEDIESIVSLCKKISSLAPPGKKANTLNVSISTFVPKAHTPFQWVPQVGLEESKRRIEIIKKGLSSRKVRVKWNNPSASWLEGIFSRGDRRLNAVLIDAWANGARFDNWNECLDLEAWKRALQNCRINPDHYLCRQRSHLERAPWEHISSGVSKEFLISELNRASVGRTSNSCRKGCPNCGVCDGVNVAPVLFDTQHSFKHGAAPDTVEPEGPAKKYRLTFCKLENSRFLSQLELSSNLLRALRRAGVILAYSQGHHPKPKVSFAGALPVGTESLNETMDFHATNINGISSRMESINKELPPGLSALSIREIGEGTALPRAVESQFHIKAQNGFETALSDRFLNRGCCPVKKFHKGSEKTVDIRPLVKEIHVLSNNELRLVIDHSKGYGMKAKDIIKEVFGFSGEEASEMRVLKTKCITE